MNNTIDISINRGAARAWLIGLAWGAQILGIIMLFLDLYNSWSEHEGEPEEPMLNGALLCIIATYLVRSFVYPHRQRMLWRFVGMRVKHLNRITAALFAGVLIFSVNHPCDCWVNTAHLVFTGAGMFTALVEPVLYFPRYSPPWWGSIAGMAVAAMLFILGYKFVLYTVSTGEVLAAWVAVVFITGTSLSKSTWKILN